MVANCLVWNREEGALVRCCTTIPDKEVLLYLYECVEGEYSPVATFGKSWLYLRSLEKLGTSDRMQQEGEFIHISLYYCSMIIGWMGDCLVVSEGIYLGEV